MNDTLATLQSALILVIPGLVAALGAWAVSWLRTHTTASAVRQATQQFGDSPEADQAAADELHRMPRLLRPGNVPKAIGKAVERQRRESVMPHVLPQVGPDNGGEAP